MATEAQIRAAIAKAEAKGDAAAVADLQSRLPKSGDQYITQPSTYDRVAGAASQFGQGYTLGMGDELMGGLVAGVQKMRGDPRSLPDLYREGRDATRGLQDEFSGDFPKTSLGLNLAGGVAGPARAIGKGAQTWADLGKAGAKAGALAGYGASESDSHLGQAIDTGLGAATGGVLGVAIPYAAQQAGNAWSAAKGALSNLLSGPTATVTQGASPTLIQQAAAQPGALSQSLPPAVGERARLVQRADDLGMKLTHGDRTGNDAVRRVEAGFKSNPLTSPPFDDVRATNQKTLNRLFAKTLGLGDDVNELTPSVLGEVDDTLGKAFNTFGKKIGSVDVDGGLGQRIQAIRKTEPFMEFADDLLTNVSGKDLMTLRSNLNKAMGKAWRDGDTIKGDYIEDTIKQIDGLVDTVVTPADRAAFRDAQQKWRMFVTIQKGKAVSEMGNVNPTSMSSALGKNYKHDYRLGKVSDPVLMDAFDANRVALMGRDIVGDSGTATRLGFLGLLRNPVETTASLAMRPVLSKYVNSGGEGMAGMLMPPETIARTTGVLTRAAETDRKTRKRPRQGL